MALKCVPDWRWLMDRKDSPWYPTMRLFRQAERDDWRDVFSEIESALRELIGSNHRRTRVSEPPNTPLAPISWGELVDKITILEIETDESLTDAARADGRKSLRLLQEIVDVHAAFTRVSHLKGELKEINGALRKFEAAIREKERTREFDSEFIELARSVSNRNDKRAFVIRQINDFLSPAIVKEEP